MIKERNKMNINNPWMQTITGKKFFILEPKIEDINIEDIAHALSRICRFNGHIIPECYSVAQHSVYVSLNCNKEDVLFGLLHDASEAFCADINSGLKKTDAMKGYRQVEHTLQSMIYNKYCGANIEPASVKEADIRMLSTEARDILGPLHPDWNYPAKPYDFKIEPLSPNAAKKLFLDRFTELTYGK